jgi:hypothetical protein
VEHWGSVEFQGSVAAIRSTLQALAHLTALGHEAERPEELAALAGRLNENPDAAQEYCVLRSLAQAGHTLAQKAVPPAQGTVWETCLRWTFAEHCPCLGTQSPSS